MCTGMEMTEMLQSRTSAAIICVDRQASESFRNGTRIYWSLSHASGLPSRDPQPGAAQTPPLDIHSPTSKIKIQYRMQRPDSRNNGE